MKKMNAWILMTGIVIAPFGAMAGPHHHDDNRKVVGLVGNCIGLAAEVLRVANPPPVQMVVTTPVTPVQTVVTTPVQTVVTAPVQTVVTAPVVAPVVTRPIHIRPIHIRPIHIRPIHIRPHRQPPPPPPRHNPRPGGHGGRR